MPERFPHTGGYRPPPADNPEAVLEALISVGAPVTPEEEIAHYIKIGRPDLAAIRERVYQVEKERRNPGIKQIDFDFGDKKRDAGPGKSVPDNEPDADRKVGPGGDTQKRQKDLDFGS